MDWKLRETILALRALELVAGQSNPEEIGPFKLDNELQRSLSHLVATNGVTSRLLQCLSSGVLRVALETTSGVAIPATALAGLRTTLYGPLGSSLVSADDRSVVTSLLDEQGALSFYTGGEATLAGVTIDTSAYTDTFVMVGCDQGMAKVEVYDATPTLIATYAILPNRWSKVLVADHYILYSLSGTVAVTYAVGIF